MQWKMPSAARPSPDCSSYQAKAITAVRGAISSALAGFLLACAPQGEAPRGRQREQGSTAAPPGGGAEAPLQRRLSVLNKCLYPARWDANPSWSHLVIQTTGTSVLTGEIGPSPLVHFYFGSSVLSFSLFVGLLGDAL